MIHSGVIIGEYGFGYVLDENGDKVMLRHYGGVTIEDNVHIGDNCIITKLIAAMTINKISNLMALYPKNLANLLLLILIISYKFFKKKRIKK